MKIYLQVLKSSIKPQIWFFHVVLLTTANKWTKMKVERDSTFPIIQPVCRRSPLPQMFPYVRDAAQTYRRLCRRPIADLCRSYGNQALALTVGKDVSNLIGFHGTLLHEIFAILIIANNEERTSLLTFKS